MKMRIAFSVLLLLLLTVLAACVPSPVVSTAEQAEPSGSLTETTTVVNAPPSHHWMLRLSRKKSSRSKTVSSCWSPNPGADRHSWYDLSYRSTALEATDLDGTVSSDYRLPTDQSGNLIAAGILTLTLLARVFFIILKKVARRTATPYDEIYLDAIKPYLRWLFGLIILYFATERLQFLSPAFKQWLAQIYFVLIVGLIVIGLWKLVDTFTMWYQEKVKDQGERSGKRSGPAAWRARSARSATARRSDRGPGSHWL